MLDIKKIRKDPQFFKDKLAVKPRLFRSKIVNIIVKCGWYYFLHFTDCKK